MEDLSDVWGFPGARSQRDILQCVSPYFSRRSTTVKSSIYVDETKKVAVAGSRNGFVWSACRAYNESRPLCIRPDDIWLAILENIGRYCIPRTTVAQSHEMLDFPTLTCKDLESPAFLAEEMKYLVNRKCFSEELTNSLIPDFSTTRSADITAACVLLLGNERNDRVYCNLKFREGGISTMNLLGPSTDWFTLLDKLNDFKDQGEEVQLFIKKIRPILRLLHYTVREPASPIANRVRNTMVRKTPPNGKDDDLVTGWITSFCYLNAEGQRRQPDEEGDGPSDQDVQAKVSENKDTMEENEEDGLFYQPISLADIPVATAVMPARFMGRSNTMNCIMIGGSIGTMCQLDKESKRVYRPLSGWILSSFENAGVAYRRQELLNDVKQEIRHAKEETEKKYEYCAIGLASLVRDIEKRLAEL